MRAGIFGGTFNPIHNGHLQVVQDVKRVFALDQVYLIPAAIPPHKSPKAIAPPQHRFHMIDIALAPFPGLHACNVELQRQGPSYTIDTVKSFLRRPQTNRMAYFYIIGQDAFLDIHTWNSFKTLLKSVPFIVMKRPLSNETPGIDQWQEALSAYLWRILSKHYTFNIQTHCFQHPLYQAIYPVDVTPMPISSTDVRRALKTGRSISRLVPDAVAAYIRNKGLYQ